MKPLKLTDDTYSELASPSLLHNSSIDILCLAKDDGVVNNYGGPYKKNVTDMSDSEWNSSNPSRADFGTYASGAVNYSGRLEAAVTAGGSTNVRFVVHDDEMKSNRVTVRIT